MKTRYKKGDFLIVPNIENLKNVSNNAGMLYVWLCHHSDENGECFPGRKRLASLIKFEKVSSVDRYIKELKDNNLISVQVRKKEGENMTNLYQILAAGKPVQDE